MSHSSRPDVRRALQKILDEAPLVYVDVGARRGRMPRAIAALKRGEYIGFEADVEECARLNQSARPGHRYLPIVIARAAERRSFHITRSPACASLLPPDPSVLAPFLNLAPLFDVERTIEIDTAPLDGSLRDHGVTPPDFLEIDTQGSELEVLAGAEAALANSLVGVQVEVEFAPMYAGQPLFADVDAFLRARGFQLFDLSRYRARRTALNADVPTRGQLLWGHAVYFRDHRELDPPRAAKLAVLAAALDFPDLAAEIFERLARPETAASLRKGAARAHAALLRSGKRGLADRVLGFFEGWRRRRASDGRQWTDSRGQSSWRD